MKERVYRIHAGIPHRIALLADLHNSDPGNTIEILRCDYTSLTLRLSPELLPLKGKVKVVYQGKTLFNNRIKPSTDTFRKTLQQMQDPCMAAPAELKITM